MSQSFDLLPDDKWIPQPSTNQLKQPRILDFGPLQGQHGDTYHIDFTIQNLDTNLLRIAFDSCFTTCHLTIDTVTQVFRIHTTVPNSNILSSADLSRVPVYLVAVQDSTKILDSWFVGYFAYYSRKRASAEFDMGNPMDSNEEAAKRSRQDPLGSPYMNTAYPAPSANYYGLPSHTPYVGLPPAQPSPRQREYFEDPTLMGYSTASYRQSDPGSFQSSYGDTGYISNAPSNAPMLAPLPHHQQTQHHPHHHQQQQQQQQQPDPYIMPMMDTMPHHQQPPPPASASNILPVTSGAPSLQMKPLQPPLPSITSPSNYPLSASQTSPVSQDSSGGNPFVNLLNKANLRIEGSLEDIIKNWTPEEWENQRRLVQFWRHQEGNEVTCRFETFHLPAEKSKQPDMNKIIVVSCIYWKERNDYYITSVDCIYLLEHLIGVKFTVEEKNRVRRNLEGYKPLTVSKLKPESAEFFKLIMGFPNPKPRNIEKDVKVFPWGTLGVALKKIISKYTASYSSTASVNYDVLTSTTSQDSASTQPG